MTKGARCAVSPVRSYAKQLVDPHLLYRLTVPGDADPGFLRWHGVSIDDPDLLRGNSAQLRNVLHVKGVRHGRRETHMKFHQEVRRHLDVESLG